MLHFHWYTSFLCCETPVSSLRPLRLRHVPLSYPLQASIRFLKHPLPSMPSIPLAGSLPLFFFFFVRGIQGLPSSVSKISFDDLGVICRPGIVLSVCHSVNQPEQPDSVPFWPKCITLFSLVTRYDPYDDSAFASPWRHFPGRLNRSGFIFIWIRLRILSC